MLSKAEDASEETPWKNETMLLSKSATVDIFKSKNLAVIPNTFKIGSYCFVSG